MVIEILLTIGVWLMDRLVPWSMLVTLALWWGRSKVFFRPSRLFLLLFVGVIEDIGAINYLGFRSGLAISLMMMAWLIARYYQSRQLWWWYVLGVVGELAMLAINKVGFSLGPVVFQLVFMGLIDWWSLRFGKQDAIYVKT